MSIDGEHETGGGRRLLLTRLAIGLAQGLVLFALSEAAEQKVWPATDRPLFIALVVMALGVGPVLLSGLGGLGRRALAIWAVAAALVTAAIGWVDGYRALDQRELIPTPPVALAVLVGLFVAHSLIVAAARDHRRIAAYPTYFDVAWKHGVQLALAAGFTGIFWGVLALGSALFNMIGVRLVGEIVQERWFAIPATALAFAAAVHLTDVRVGLIQGVRTVALTLLGWLLPLLAGLTLAFLLTLPFTGLKPLWDTRNASIILIGAGAALILLINAAYQDGGRDKPLPVALRWAMRLAGLLLAPLAILATYALCLRIGQYGLTIDRVIAVACVIVGACYAIGYAVAAVLPGPAMRRLEPTNVATSFVGLAVLLALLTPLADPVRLSVDDQVARLRAGKVKPQEFDFKYLKFQSGRFGKDALVRLKAAGGETGRLAAEADKLSSRWSDAEPSHEQQSLDSIKVYPAGRAMPESLKGQWPKLTGGDCDVGLGGCELFMIDLNGDGREEGLIASSSSALWVMEEAGAEGWVRRGSVDARGCHADRLLAALRSGEAQARLSRWREIDIGGTLLTIQPLGPDCVTVPPRVSAEPPVQQRR